MEIFKQDDADHYTSLGAEKRSFPGVLFVSTNTGAGCSTCIRLYLAVLAAAMALNHFWLLAKWNSIDSIVSSGNLSHLPLVDSILCSFGQHPVATQRFN